MAALGVMVALPEIREMQVLPETPEAVVAEAEAVVGLGIKDNFRSLYFLQLREGQD
jgi:hypothetical protein